MQRHLADHPRTETPAIRTRVFLAIQRALRPSFATLALQRRRVQVTSAAALPQFLRIASGRQV